MKSLSVRQPWASLQMQGAKTLEIRSWQTSYRGDLLICASSKVSPLFKIDTKKREGNRVFTYDPADPEFCGFLDYGKALFVCHLVDITPFEKHHERDAWITHIPGQYAWHLANIRPVEPFDVKGKLNFFEVPDEKLIYI